MTSGGSEPIRVLVVDPLPLFCDGVRAAIEPHGFSVATPDDQRRWVVTDISSIVLLSLLTTADWTTLGELCRIRSRAGMIAVLDAVTPAVGARALMMGASAVMRRDIGGEQLRGIVEALCRGESTVPTDVLHETVRRSARWNDDIDLEEREQQWLAHLSSGQPVAQVAVAAGYSERMMFRLLRDLYTKLGVANRTEALLRARERGWV